MKPRTLLDRAGAAAGAVAAYTLVLRPWHLRWGATDEELHTPFPGQDPWRWVRLPTPVTASSRRRASGGANEPPG